jgi:hypothetical protein
MLKEFVEVTSFDKKKKFKSVKSLIATNYSRWPYIVFIF